MRPPAAGADAVRGPRSASGSPGPARPGAEPTRRPAASPPLAPPPRPRRPVLSPAEARKLLEAIDTGTLAGLRDRALLSVMLYSFARVSERGVGDAAAGLLRARESGLAPDTVTVDEIERIVI